MNIEFFIAKRYLRTKHKLHFISIISFISTIGISIGVAALIIVLSVFNGFSSLVSSILINFDPHLRITSIAENPRLQMDSIKSLLERNNKVLDFYAFTEGKAIVKKENILSVFDLKGFDYKTDKDVWGVKSSLKYGKYILKDDNDIIIGLNLATKLQSLIGDTITITSFNNVYKSVLMYSMPVTRKYVVRGIFESNNNDYDFNYVFTSLRSAQNLLAAKGKILGYEVRLKNMEESNRLRDEFKSVLGKDYSVQSWFDLHKDLYSMMLIERWAAYIILSLIIAVATFNVLGSLTMSVIEKKKDIGILRSMGIKEKSIVRIFMFEGMLVGFIGTITGALLGLAVVLIQLNFKIYPLDPTRYIIDALPMELRISDFIAVAGMSFLLSAIASLYPASRALKIKILDAIKWE